MRLLTATFQPQLPPQKTHLTQLHVWAFHGRENRNGNLWTSPSYFPRAERQSESVQRVKLSQSVQIKKRILSLCDLCEWIIQEQRKFVILRIKLFCWSKSLSYVKRLREARRNSSLNFHKNRKFCSNSIYLWNCADSRFFLSASLRNWI